MGSSSHKAYPTSELGHDRSIRVYKQQEDWINDVAVKRQDVSIADIVRFAVDMMIKIDPEGTMTEVLMPGPYKREKWNERP